MSYTSKGTSEILVAGLQDQMFTIDVDKGTIIKQVPTPCYITSMPTYTSADTYKRPLHNNETEQTYLRCNKDWRGSYPGLHHLQCHQGMERALFPHQ